MYDAQFDGNAAFAGGGFMPLQATQTADPGFSSASKNIQLLVPVTVRQVHDALQSNEDKMDFTVDGVEATSVRLVGLLVSKTERVTDVSFTVDDGTGRIDCNRWMNDPTDMKEMEAVSEGMYVRVHGHLKGFLGKKHLVSFCIRPVIDFDEIANHFVECIYVHSYNTKSRKQPVTAPTPSQIPRGYQTVPQNSYAKQSDTDHLTGVTKSIIDYLQRPLVLDSENGASMNEIAQHIGVPLQQIRDASDFLINEGMAYTTLDDYLKSALNG
jgi:replication factor A2